jgi:hypothetical protein
MLSFSFAQLFFKEAIKEIGSSTDLSPAEVAVDARRGKIGWPSVNIVYGFFMKVYCLNILEYRLI